MYELEERTAVFGEKVITFCKNIPQNIITNPLISQLLRAGTSIGANYAEANGASLEKDFRNKIYICKKEAQEAKYWIRMMIKAIPDCEEESTELWQETHELNLNFQKITSTIDKKNKI